LAKLLLPPALTRQAGGIRELLIVPQGPLASVSFAALPFDSAGPLLGARFAIRYAPSLAALAEAERRPRRARTELRQSLVVGNPTMPTVTTAAGTRVTLDLLPGSASEGKWVARYLGAPLLTGSEATQLTVERRLARARLSIWRQTDLPTARNPW